MTLLNLALVTKTIVNLLEKRVGQLLGEHFSPAEDWPANTTLTVTTVPPGELETGNALDLYLYHILEDAHFKSAPPPGADEPPIRYTPMGLALYYQLTSFSDQKDKTGRYREQLLLGLAVKTLHDYPLIDETTKVNGSEILHPDLKGGNNRVRIMLQPVPYDQAVSYWTAGSQPLRLAAYYQVSVVLLEPEEPRSRVGRVLVYGVHAFAGGAPRLDSSSNVAAITLPGEAEPRRIELRPAQAPPAAPAPPPPPGVSQVTWIGSNLAGSRTRLLLRNARWSDPVEVDSAWHVVAEQERVTAVIQETAGAEDILPGVYGALIEVVTKRTMPDGQLREFEHRSNEMPFVIVPRIDEITKATAGGVTIVTVTGYVFRHGAPPKDQDVKVYLGNELLAATAAASPAAGEFKITGDSTLELRPPAGLIGGGWVPLRVFVNGAESLPRWVEL